MVYSIQDSQNFFFHFETNKIINRLWTISPEYTSYFRATQWPNIKYFKWVKFWANYCQRNRNLASISNYFVNEKSSPISSDESPQMSLLSGQLRDSSNKAFVTMDTYANTVFKLLVKILKMSYERQYITSDRLYNHSKKETTDTFDHSKFELPSSELISEIFKYLTELILQFFNHC